MCTYNGEQFLSQQLSSIAQQSRLPDELVVCDDRSTDGTMEILREFAASVSFAVTIIQNKQTFGSTKNFEQAIRLCSGDLIALSDQDDIWYPNRLERSEQELINTPQAGLVFSNADLIGDQGRLLGTTLWQSLGFTATRQHDLLAGRYVVLAKHRFVTGATVVLRAALRDRCLPISEGWVHDEWIAMVIAAFSDLRPIEQPLIRYRIHGSQQVGFRNKLEQRVQGKTRAQRHWGRLGESVKELQHMCDVLSAMALDPSRGVLPAYRQHLQFLSFRYGLPASRLKRLRPVLARHAEYAVHASGWRSVAKDLILKRQPLGSN